MAPQDDLNTSAVALVGFLGAVLVFIVIVALMVVFYRVETQQQYAKEILPAYSRSAQLAADQQGRLADYAWVDAEKRIARIPIERAMELVVEELARNPLAEVIGVPAQTPAPASPGPAPGWPDTLPGNGPEPAHARTSDNDP